MQRRHKGHKSRPGNSNSAWGGEYWGRRPGPRDPGKETKKITHRIERRVAKQNLRTETKFDPQNSD